VTFDALILIRVPRDASDAGSQREDKSMQSKIILAVAALLLAPTAAVAQTPASGDAKLYFISPQNGETIQGPVTIRFGLTGMGVAPAGVEKEKTGHHHLLVDTGLPKMDEPIPTDDKHRHFGGGQTEATITLPPGQHTLQLLLGDWTHIPHKPAVMSEKITITVR
jgi:hypothetical protein